MENGLWTKDYVPAYFGVVAKRLSADQSSPGCWKVDTAAIDFQAPATYGTKLDEYLDNVVLPALLAAGGPVSVHMGKRLASNSALLQESYSFYNAACGVSLDVATSPCYHPACTRSLQITDFDYPDGLVRPIKE